MIYIHHRINLISDLKKVPPENGIELDIRYHENHLILHHEPFHHHENAPEKFEDLLSHWQHQGPMILNIKTEGVEDICIRLMEKYHITNWFFLDLSMPYFVSYAEYASQGKWQNFTPHHLAVRFSEYEPIEYALAFRWKSEMGLG